jgi:hypothetical protein
MRFNGFVKTTVGDIVHLKYDKVVSLATNINGGWELWLQCEIFLKLLKEAQDKGMNPDNLGFTREQQYPNSNKISDFAFVPPSADTTKTWVELKVQKKSNVEAAIDEFIQDINKFDTLHFAETETAGAMLVVPVNPWGALNKAQAMLGSSRNNKLGYVLADANGVSAATPFSKFPQQTEVNNKVLILYYLAR